MSVLLRRYRPADREGLLDLWCSAWEATLPGHDFRTDWATVEAQWDGMLDEGGRITVAEGPGGALLGFLILDADGGFVEQIAVAPASFGKGVGAGLLDHAKQAAGARLTLTVNTFNARAIRFYEREGFRRLGQETNAATGLPVWRYEWRPAPVAAPAALARPA